MTPASDGPTVELTLPVTAPTFTTDGADPTAPRDAPAGFALPGYEILGELGRGGMGVVYKARQVALDRAVALKVVLGAAHAGPTQLARFRAEATAAARLSHPNIVQVFEVGEHAGSPFFSLELVEGGTLADRLRGEPQPPRQAAELVRTLARAVEHAHERGVVHRDLKPANVLLQSPPSAVPSPPSKDTRPGTAGAGLGTAKIADFGLAKQSAGDSKLTQSGAILGTPSYMAPEQAAGDGKAVGPAADVYALGAILYECLTGRPPFRAASVMDTVLQVLHDDPVPPSRLQPKLPRDLETVCLKCLAKNPEQRYPSAAELADDLERFLNGEPVRARPTSAVVKGWKWARRHPARAVVLFILAIPLPLLLGVMVYLWADARSARAAAVADRDRADRERELAQGYLQNALGTMDKVLDRVADGPLARLPDAQEERTAVLADAIAFYETLLRLDSTDPAVRFDTAQTYHRVSRLATLAGRVEQAEASGRTSIRMLTELVRENPDRPAYRNELARARMFFGHARLLNGDYDGAVEAYRRAAAEADALVGHYPGEPAYRETAAECHRSLGYYFSGRQPAEAERHFTEALRLADEVYAGRPDAEHRALLVSVLGAYGQFLVTARRLGEAERVLDRGAALIDPKAGPPPPGGPARLNYDQGQLAIWYALAQTYAMTRRVERAETLVGDVIRGYEGLVAGQPRAFPYRLQAVQAYAFLTQLDDRGKRYPEAVRSSRRALELLDGLVRDYPGFRGPQGFWLQLIRQGLLSALARGLLNTGSRDEAIRVVGELDPAVPGWPGGQAYDVGCLFALLAAGAAGSTRDEFAAKAMAWLKKAAAAGYPGTPGEVEHVRTGDADLKALRDRPEFREWAKDLKPAKGK